MATSSSSHCHGNVGTWDSTSVLGCSRRCLASGCINDLLIPRAILLGTDSCISALLAARLWSSRGQPRLMGHRSLLAQRWGLRHIWEALQDTSWGWEVSLHCPWEESTWSGSGPSSPAALVAAPTHTAAPRDHFPHGHAALGICPGDPGSAKHPLYGTQSQSSHSKLGWVCNCLPAAFSSA